MDKRKRLKRLAPKVQTVVDIESRNFFDYAVSDALRSKQQHTERMMGKMKAHGMNYGVGDFSRFESRMLRGSSYHSIIHDEITSFSVKTQTHEARADKNHLSVEEWRWAVAFRSMMGVNQNFYEDRPVERRREIEAEWEHRAAKNTIIGKSAARVVAKRVAMTIEGASPPSAKTEKILGDLINSGLSHKVMKRNFL